MTNSDPIVSKPGFLTITHKENPSYVYFDWENFGISLDDCVDAFARAEKAMVEHGVFRIITNTAKVKQALRPEVAKWWGEVCMPSLAKCGVKLIVSVVPASANAQQSTESGRADVVNNIVILGERSGISSAGFSKRKITLNACADGRMCRPSRIFSFSVDDVARSSFPPPSWTDVDDLRHHRGRSKHCDSAMRAEASKRI